MSNQIDRAVTLKQFIGGGITLLIAIGGTFINSLLTLREIEIRVESLEKTVTSVTRLDGKIEVLLERTSKIEDRQREFGITSENIRTDILELYKNRRP